MSLPHILLVQQVAGSLRSGCGRMVPWGGTPSVWTSLRPPPSSLVPSAHPHPLWRRLALSSVNMLATVSSRTFPPSSVSADGIPGAVVPRRARRSAPGACVMRMCVGLLRLGFTERHQMPATLPLPEASPLSALGLCGSGTGRTPGEGPALCAWLVYFSASQRPEGQAGLNPLVTGDGLAALAPWESSGGGRTLTFPTVYAHPFWKISFLFRIGILGPLPR